MLPKPHFSPENRYWVPPTRYWGWLQPHLRPRLNAHDFLYATTYELEKIDWFGAYIKRKDWIKFVCRRFLLVKKEKAHEKAV